MSQWCCKDPQVLIQLDGARWCALEFFRHAGDPIHWFHHSRSHVVPMSDRLNIQNQETSDITIKTIMHAVFYMSPWHPAFKAKHSTPTVTPSKVHGPWMSIVHELLVRHMPGT